MKFFGNVDWHVNGPHQISQFMLNKTRIGFGHKAFLAVSVSASVDVSVAVTVNVSASENCNLVRVSVAAFLYLSYSFFSDCSQAMASCCTGPWPTRTAAYEEFCHKSWP